MTWNNGLVSNAAGSGYEVNLALAALALVIVFLGTGRFSLDAYLVSSSSRGTHPHERHRPGGVMLVRHGEQAP